MPYPGRKYECQYWDAIGVQTVLDTSVRFPQYGCWTTDGAVLTPVLQVSMMTRGQVQQQTMICDTSPSLCPKVYNQTETGPLFYVADIELFTILVDHGVLSLDLDIGGVSRFGWKTPAVMLQIIMFTCLMPRSNYEGKIEITENDGMCASEVSATTTPTGTKKAMKAPCYISPNTTASGVDFFSLGTLLAAAGEETSDPRASWAA
jgi:hypothetical protein